MNVFKEVRRRWRRWRSDRLFERVILAQDHREKKRLLADLVDKYGGRLLTRGPCSHAIARGENWVSYSWSRPDDLCTKSELKARGSMKAAILPFRRVKPEKVTVELVEVKPLEDPSMLFLESRPEKR